MQAGRVDNQSLDSLLKDKIPALGLDLGGTKLNAALVVDYQLVGEPHTVATPDSPEKIVDAIVDLIGSFTSTNVVAGVGIATAGVVNVETGDIVGSTPNLPGWTGTPLKTLVETRTMLPVWVENDANAAAYGDCYSMDFGNRRCVVAVTLGTGIGTGIVLNGELYRGAHFVAGECGHIRIALDNRRMCTCGLFDCWEAYGSGRGLVATTRDLLVGVNAEQSPLARDLSRLDTHMIEDALNAGDIIAQKALRIYHEHVATGLVTLAHTLDPDCFILSGGMAKLIDYDLLREIVADRSLPRIAENVKILPSKLGRYAGIVGAAHLALRGLAGTKSR